jgi:hypothetical protein
VRTKSLSTAAGVKPSDSYPSTKFNNRRRQQLGEDTISLEAPAKKVLPLSRAGDKEGAGNRLEDEGDEDKTGGDVPQPEISKYL